VPGRANNFNHRRRSGFATGFVQAAGALAGLAISVGIGYAIASRGESPAASVTTVTVASPESRAPHQAAAATSAPTRASAVSAAARSLTAFDGSVLLEPSRLQTIVAKIASAESRAQLSEAFSQASAQTREKLGAGTVPTPVIVLRSVPIGYRIERFSAIQATIAIWYVGIVGSGATIQPQQSWRTEVVSLVWEHGAWKVSSFKSSAGPTPPLSTAEVPGTPNELFTDIPRFEEFSHAEP
jgi:hypothetical protein